MVNTVLLWRVWGGSKTVFSLKNPEEKNSHPIIKFKTSEGTTHIHPEDRFHLQNLQQNLRFYRNPNFLFYFLCYNKKLPLLAPCFLVFSAGVHRWAPSLSLRLHVSPLRQTEGALIQSDRSVVQKRGPSVAGSGLAGESPSVCLC